MSWTFRAPRQPVQGWHAPHELVDAYAARGVEIARLHGALNQTEHQLLQERAEIRRLDAHIQDLNGRIECQADRIEAERAEWETTKRMLMGRITELEQTVVAMFEQVPGLDGHFDRIVSAGLGADTSRGPQ